MQETLFNYPNLEVKTGMVFDLLFNHDPSCGSSAEKQWGKVAGVRLGTPLSCEEHCLTELTITKDTGETISCSAVVICTGTFLGGEIHIGTNPPHSSKGHTLISSRVGMKSFPAGRMGDTASPTTGLSASLRSAGFALGRLKTGTPARLLKSSINFVDLEEQIGDATPRPFSFLHSSVPNASNQVSCYKTYTSPLTRQIVLDNLHRSIHIRETVKGPRYCPSLEAKILRFKDKEAHIVWLEPEGYDSELIYPNGISCSMPEDVQVDLVRSIPGLEKAEIVRPAYGVEYDHVDARELRGVFFCILRLTFYMLRFAFCVLRFASVSVPVPRIASHRTASRCISSMTPGS